MRVITLKMTDAEIAVLDTLCKKWDNCGRSEALRRSMIHSVNRVFAGTVGTQQAMEERKAVGTRKRADKTTALPRGYKSHPPRYGKPMMKRTVGGKKKPQKKPIPASVRGKK